MGQQQDGELKSGLVDLSDLDFARIDATPAPVLRRLLHKVLRDHASDVDHYAAFQNRIGRSDDDD